MFGLCRIARVQDKYCLLKLLFDQNISFRLIDRIHNDFPLSHSLRVLGLNDATDFEIWKSAKKNNYVIVTFDSDFLDLNTLYGSPPKIIWLRTGNMTMTNLAQLLINRKIVINKFFEEENAEILQILSDS